MQKLTVEQKKLVEESLWVVNSIMKNQALEGDKDIRQQAMLYMCRCAQRFDPTRGVKWTTYAYQNAKLYIKRIVKREQNIQSLFEDIEVVSCPESDLFATYSHETASDAKYIVDTLKSRCSPEELQILTMKEQGYKWYEISQALNCSTSTLNGKMQVIRDKAKSILK